ncbi:MAG: ribosome-associated translation inhibitor RaiA [Endomicrobium sp.]|nr:ribosome-associated translation inhibitor RaiA [Endomicrobium sp.]
MRIDITARRLKLTGSIDSYVRKKITKVGKFYDTDDICVHVILSVEKIRHITEIILYIGKLSLVSKGYSYDLYSSIDLTVDKLEKQIKKQKEVSKVHRKNNLKVSRNKKYNIEEVSSCNDIENSREKISEIRRFDLESETLEEAIDNMDNLAYKVYMFKDGIYVME